MGETRDDQFLALPKKTASSNSAFAPILWATLPCFIRPASSEADRQSESLGSKVSAKA